MSLEGIGTDQEERLDIFIFHTGCAIVWNNVDFEEVCELAELLDEPCPAVHVSITAHDSRALSLESLRKCKQLDEEERQWRRASGNSMTLIETVAEAAFQAGKKYVWDLWNEVEMIHRDSCEEDEA